MKHSKSLVIQSILECVPLFIIRSTFRKVLLANCYPFLANANQPIHRQRCIVETVYIFAFSIISAQNKCKSFYKIILHDSCKYTRWDKKTLNLHIIRDVIDMKIGINFSFFWVSWETLVVGKKKIQIIRSFRSHWRRKKCIENSTKIRWENAKLRKQEQQICLHNRIKDCVSLLSLFVGTSKFFFPLNSPFRTKKKKLKQKSIWVKLCYATRNLFVLFWNWFFRWKNFSYLIKVNVKPKRTSEREREREKDGEGVVLLLLVPCILFMVMIVNALGSWQFDCLIYF